QAVPAGRIPPGDVGPDPLHLDPALARHVGGLLQGNPREVDAGDVPSQLSQPARVAPLTARDVEGGAGLEAGQILGHELVGPGRPHQGLLPVALVPAVGIHHISPWNGLVSLPTTSSATERCSSSGSTSNSQASRSATKSDASNSLRSGSIATV